ncbi:SDR family oxidoreductase [Streptomyces sp. H10-C2]|uniref:SDR family NAD(P)-dependent oxidoreductase n=1 Tax=unclassified Streptomyces TaxID=2593676 RepID=UPI0024B9E9FB|nr:MULTISPECIES: SDR family oxidoreductase [unclassified Streptomyces]MDJ0345923.1 SDR family oxidoreductase [Streptomyces sp. PH10-H1]MDJ0374772.1 SDR family oxidoreductase [Streptomyces sp. H10-C2]
MRAQVSAGAQPWKSAYDKMLASPYASLSRTVKPRSVVECGSYSNPSNGCTDEREDAIAAYTDALAWYIGQDHRYADKAVQLMDAWSAVVNIGSRGAFRGEPDHPAYGATKAAVHALGQSLAVALAPHGIAVASVAPGFIETDRVAHRLAGAGGEAIRAQSPFGRVAAPAEIAAAALWLASPAALWASGTVLDVNGASYLRT